MRCTVNGDPVVAQGVQSHQPLCRVGEAEAVPQLPMDLRVVKDEGGGVEAEVAEVPLLLAEDHAPHRRVNSVGADQHVGVECCPVREGDAYAVARVLDPRDAAAEAQLDAVHHLFAKGQLQVRAQDAQQPVVHASREAPEVHSRSPPAGAVQVTHLVDLVPELDQPGQDSHRLGRVIAGPEEVDHVPLPTRAGGLLHHDDIPAEKVEALGEGEARDARSADDCLHINPLSVSYGCHRRSRRSGPCAAPARPPSRSAPG